MRCAKRAFPTLQCGGPSNRHPAHRPHAGRRPGERTRQVPARVRGRLAPAGSDRTGLPFAHAMIPDMRDFAGMNEVRDAWVDPETPPPPGPGVADPGSPDMKVAVVITTAVKQRATRDRVQRAPRVDLADAQQRRGVDPVTDVREAGVAPPSRFGKQRHPAAGCCDRLRDRVAARVTEGCEGLDPAGLALLGDTRNGRGGPRPPRPVRARRSPAPWIRAC
jgi:hypothetical protein